MRWLAPKERDGFGRTHRYAHDGAGGAVDAAWQVDGEDRRAIGIDRLDHVEGLAAYRPIQARTKQRVDDQRRLADRVRIKRQHRVLPSPRRGSRVVLETVALAQENDRDLAAARGELCGGYKTIPAIIPWASDHKDRTVVHQIHGGLGDRLARAQHQRKARSPGGDGEPIGTLHLGGG